MVTEGVLDFLALESKLFNSPPVSAVPARN